MTRLMWEFLVIKKGNFMKEECIHLDRLAYAIFSNDKTEIMSVAIDVLKFSEKYKKERKEMLNFLLRTETFNL